jgi:hypothetical protein
MLTELLLQDSTKTSVKKPRELLTLVNRNHKEATRILKKLYSYFRQNK